MAAESTEKKMLTLKSSDNEEFVIEESVAIQSVTIKNMVEDDCASSVIPLPNVNSANLVKLIEYLKKHDDSTVSEDDLKKFDADFVKEELQIADEIKDKSCERVREIFNITNDYTPEEYEKIRKENEWAFEGVED